MDDWFVIVWGMYMGWSDYRTAAKINCHRSTVWSYKQRIYNDPRFVFKLPLVNRSGKEWRCELCRDTRPTLDRCRRHLLEHIMPWELARGSDLSGLPTPL